MKKTIKTVSGTEINPIDAHVGRQLRVRRTLMGWSQEDLANKVELTFQQIQKYENGKNRIGASRLYELGLCLDVPVAYFFESLSQAAGRTESWRPNISNHDLNSKETLELVKVFYSLKDPNIRDKLLKMLKSISAEVTEKN